MKKTVSTLLFSLTLLTCAHPQIKAASSALWQSTLSFDQILQQNQFVVIKFWMPGCRPCRKLTPIFEAASDIIFTQNILFLTINVHENPEIANRYSIKSVPQILYLKKGQLADKQAGGTITTAQIETKIHELLNI
jgi:thiol-disulfide isomerase/thioredoxin